MKNTKKNTLCKFYTESFKDNNSVSFSLFSEPFKCVFTHFILSPNMDLRKNVSQTVYPLWTSNFTHMVFRMFQRTGDDDPTSHLGHMKKYLVTFTKFGTYNYINPLVVYSYTYSVSSNRLLL